jgi:hypothetical protein
MCNHFSVLTSNWQTLEFFNVTTLRISMHKNCFALWIVLALASANSFGQDSKITDLLADNTAAVIEVENIDAIGRLLVPDDWDRLSTIWKTVTSQPYPLLNAESSEDIQRIADEIVPLINRVNKIYVVIHNWNQSIPQVSIVVVVLDKTSADSLVHYLDELIGAIKHFNVRLEPDNEFLESSQPDKLSGQPANLRDAVADYNVLVDSILEMRQSWKQVAVEFQSRNLVVISNCDLFANQVLTKVDLKGARRLGSSRRFRTYQKFCESHQNEHRILSVYSEPGLLRPIFSEIRDDAQWKALGVDEIPVVAITLSAKSPGLVVARSLLTATQPASGVSTYWGSYTPVIEVPKCAFPMATFAALGVHREKYVEARQKYYTEAYGEGTYEEALEGLYGPMNESLFDSLKHCTRERFDVTFFDSTSGIGSMNFQRIINREAMLEVAEAQVEQRNRERSEGGLKLEQREYRGATIWTYSLPAEKLRQQKYLYAYAIVGDWYIHGDYDPVLVQVDYMIDQDCQKLILSELIPDEMKFEVRNFKATSMSQSRADYERYLARFTLTQRLRAKFKDLPDAESSKSIKKIAFSNEFEFPIHSRLDRLAAVQYALQEVLIEKFGTHTSLFRARDQNFESIWIFSR